MSFTSRPMIPGSSMAIPFRPGLFGIPCRASGSVAPISPLESVSESAGTAGTAGGWGHWGANWGGHTLVYNHNAYISHSNTFYNRNNYYRNGGERGVANNVNRGFNGDNRTNTLGHNGAGEQHEIGR